MQAGSSLNGDISITFPIYQQVPKPSVPEGQDSAAVPQESTLYLSERKGTKIDFIRMMNAWYECGNVVDAHGQRPTKKDFFIQVGRLFHIDLSHYDNDLSGSMSSSVALEKQTLIFDRLKEKHEEIYNSK